MGFTNDFSKATQPNGIKPEGDYEVIITKAEERITKSGATGLNLSMVIRNDVEQKFKNGYIFHTIWKRKEPTAADMQVNGYGFGQIMALGKAAGLPDGKNYADLAAFLADVVKRPVRVHLVHEEYKGELQERVQYLEPTRFPEVKHVMKKNVDAAISGEYAKPSAAYANQSAAAPATPNNGFVAMPLDEDLPF